MATEEDMEEAGGGGEQEGWFEEGDPQNQVRWRM